MQQDKKIDCSRSKDFNLIFISVDWKWQCIFLKKLGYNLPKIKCSNCKDTVDIVLYIDSFM